MAILDTNSLAATLDALNEARFFGSTIPKSDAKRIARWIAGRQGLPRSYADMFAPRERDFVKGFTLFTGEPVTSNASKAHILGEEACRALILLSEDTGESFPSLAAATAGMIGCLIEFEARGKPAGFYCCGTCSSALWRHLAVGGLSDQDRRLSTSIRYLKTLRDGAGKWRRFPYHYTLLALLEVDTRSAIAELKYAAPGCERLLKQRERDDRLHRRRRAVAERVLEKV